MSKRFRSRQHVRCTQRLGALLIVIGPAITAFVSELRPTKPLLLLPLCFGGTPSSPRVRIHEIGAIHPKKGDCSLLASASGWNRASVVRSSKEFLLRLYRDSRVRRTAKDEESREQEVADWRDFRARLHMKELAEAHESANPEELDVSSMEAEKWAYASPLIEQGSLLLSAPGDHFALNQQYFHKSVILILRHDEGFTQGVILNRPTAFRAHDMPTFPKTFSGGDWNVWCGGDCDGFNSRTGEVNYTCLHSLERLANTSDEVFRGVYEINLEEAQKLVDANLADKDDFLLLVGYCGWGPGQLQRELDNGDTWTMAAASPKQVLGRYRQRQEELANRLEEVLQGRAAGLLLPMTSEIVDDGLSEWARLYEALGRHYAKEMSLPSMAEQLEHVDEMLRKWINRCLIPVKYRFPEEVLPLDDSTDEVLGGVEDLELYTVFRGSATAWLLGKPSEDRIFNRYGNIPAQYLHKSVLVLLTPVVKDEPAWFLLVNGPKVGLSPDGICDGIRFGGINALGNRILELKGASGTVHRFQGAMPLMYDEIKAMVELRALTPVPDVSYQDLLDIPLPERWTAAKGQVMSIVDARTSQLGDVQIQKWYKRFLDLEAFDDDEVRKDDDEVRKDDEST